MPTEEQRILDRLESGLRFARQLLESRRQRFGSGVLVNLSILEVAELTERLKIRRRMSGIMAEVNFGSKPQGWPYVTRIASSKEGAEPYTVTLDNLEGIGTCTCKGFGYRSKCRHLQLATEEARAAGLVSPEIDDIIDTAPAFEPEEAEIDLEDLLS